MNYKIVWDKSPSAKVIRLAKDIMKQANPLFRSDENFIADQVISVCKLNVPRERIINNRKHKDILFHKVIDSVKNGKVITKRVRRVQ